MPKQPDRAGHERQIVRQDIFAEQRFRDAGGKQIGDAKDLVGRAPSPRADQHRDFAACVENRRGALEIALCGDDVRLRHADTRVHHPVLARWFGDRVEFLHVVRNDETRHRALHCRNPHGAVDQMAHLFGSHRSMDILMRDVLEQRVKVDLLLIAPADCRSGGLADDRDDRLVIHLGVVEAVEKMDGAGARGGEADTDFASELRMTTRHEGAHLLVARLDELDAIPRAFERAHEAIDPVSGIAVDAPHAPVV